VEVQSTPAKPDKINAGAFLFYAAGSDIFCSFSITYNLEGFYSGGLGSRRYTGKTLGFTNVYVSPGGGTGTASCNMISLVACRGVNVINSAAI
jgi:hypothetical protein